MRNYKQIDTETEEVKNRKMKNIKLGIEIVICWLLFIAIIINL